MDCILPTESIYHSSRDRFGVEWKQDFVADSIASNRCRDNWSRWRPGAAETPFTYSNHLSFSIQIVESLFF